MTPLRISIAAALAASCTGAAAAVPLDWLIAFHDPYLCHPAKDFDALLNGVIHWEELKKPTASNDIYRGRLVSPPVPMAFRKQIGAAKLKIEGNEYRATVPLQGTWQGLPLHSLVVVQWIESEGGFYLVFDASPEQVLAAANKAGFRIPSTGKESRDGEGMDVHVGVITYAGLGALYCFDG